MSNSSLATYTLISPNKNSPAIIKSTPSASIVSSAK